MTHAVADVITPCEFKLLLARRAQGAGRRLGPAPPPRRGERRPLLLGLSGGRGPLPWRAAAELRLLADRARGPPDRRPRPRGRGRPAGRRRPGNGSAGRRLRVR